MEVVVTALLFIVTLALYKVYQWSEERRRRQQARLNRVDGDDVQPVPLLPERRTVLGGHVGWIKEQIRENGGLQFVAHIVAHRRHKMPVFALQFGPVGFARRMCVVTDSRLADKVLHDSSIGPNEQIADLMEFLVGKSAMFALRAENQVRKHQRLLRYVFVKRHHEHAVATTWNLSQEHLQNLAKCHEAENSTANSSSKTMQKVDVVDTVRNMVKDIMALTCFGIRLPEGKTDGSKVEFPEALEELLTFSNRLAFKPSLTLWKASSPLEWRRCLGFRTVVINALLEQVAQRRQAANTYATGGGENQPSSEGAPSDSDLLTLMVEAEDDGYDREYIDGNISVDGAHVDGRQSRKQPRARAPEIVTFQNPEIAEEALMMFLVGYKTLASSFTWLLYHLGKHPYAQQLVYKEVRGVLGQGKSSHSAVSANAAPSMEALNEMTFSRWVILESMRLRPSAPLLARHVTEDTIIGGYEFQKGDSVLISTYIIQRAHEDFDAADTFSASRWNPDDIGSMRDASFLAFGAGARKCPVQDLAILQLLSMLSTWVLNWQTYLAVDKVDERVTFTYEPRQLFLHLEPREAAED